ncbi:hypothetical protein [Escherichia phage JN01]|uniref:Uncharacterized protein n=1 Tax=Escherichia phage JN01 TaxID=2692737 RepID=A0A6B9SP87_9CAUD|nr:hypothetical protein [Escherichia phage JN01]
MKKAPEGACILTLTEDFSKDICSHRRSFCSSSYPSFDGAILDSRYRCSISKEVSDCFRTTCKGKHKSSFQIERAIRSTFFNDTFST